MNRRVSVARLRAGRPNPAGRAAVLLLFVVASGSCRGSGGDGGAGSGTITTVDEGEIQFEIADCQRSADCGWIARSAEKRCEEEQVARLKKYRTRGELEDAVASGRAAFDPGRAEACIRAIKGAVCDQLLTAEATCLLAFKPLAPNGAPCRSGVECRDGYCDFNGDCPGICRPLLPAGSPCDPDTQSDAMNCSPSEFCSRATKKCAPKLSKGAVCIGPGECVGELQCIGYDRAAGTAGTCKEFASEGEACHGLFTSDCDLDHACLDDVCRPPVPAGGSCNHDGACAQGLSCVGPDKAQKCSPTLDAGKPCDPALGISSGCPEDMDCDTATKVCTVKGPRAGDDCSMQPLCGGDLYCDPTTRKCAPRLTVGQACMPPVDAVSASINEPCYASTCDPATKTCVLMCPSTKP